MSHIAYEPRLLAAQAAPDAQGQADERHFAAEPIEPVLDPEFGKTVGGDKAMWRKYSVDRAAWLEADAAARTAAGVEATEQAIDAAQSELIAIAAALATGCRTLAGIAFKLRLCNVRGGDTVAEAILDDIEAMGFSVELFD